MKLTKNQQYILFAVGGVLVLIFIFYQFILKPVEVDIVSLQAKLEQKQKDLDAAKQMLAKYDEFKKQSSATSRELVWAQSRMPSSLDKGQFVQDLDALQADSGVFLTNFRFQTVPGGEKSSSYTEVPSYIEFNASFDQLMKFLYEMSVSQNLMIVHSLKLAAYVDKSGLNSDQTLNAQMILSGIQGKKP